LHIRAGVKPKAQQACDPLHSQILAARIPALRAFLIFF
jgi:hypothetical protein